jgi:type III secretion system low calcium response chaperone LcrH/SycD
MAENDAPLVQRLQRWAEGRSTLKEVRGYTDEELHSIARMGYFFFHQGKLEQARTIFQGLYAVNPLDSYVARALGVVEMAAGNPAGAMAAYDVAIKVSPDDAEAYTGRAEVKLAQGDRAAALEDLRRAARMLRGEGSLQTKVRTLIASIARR